MMPIPPPTPLFHLRHAHLLALLFAVLAGLYLWGHGRYHLTDVDEAIFTQATVEMVQGGDYTLPHYNGQPRYHKPPLIYWLQAASLQAFGAVPYQAEMTPFAARLPSALCGLLAVLLFYLFTRAITRNPRMALVAATVLGLNLSWFIVVRAAIADAALNLLMLTSTMYLLWLLYTERKGALWQMLGGILLALGLLAKGPIALFPPFVAVGVAMLAKPHFLNNLRILNPLIILPAMAIGVAPWVYSIVQQHGWQGGYNFLYEFIMVHNIQRFAAGLGNTHSSSYFYYIPVFLVGFFPWSVLFIAALPTLARNALASLRAHPAQALPIIGALWALAVLALFSFSGTKLVHYIVPALPGAALAIAGWLEHAAPQPRRLLAVCGITLAALLGAVWWLFNPLLVAARVGADTTWLTSLGIAWPPVSQPAADILAQTLPLSPAPYVMGLAIVLSAVLGFVWFGKRPFRAIATFAAGQGVFLAALVVGFMPMVSAYVQQPQAELAIKMQAFVAEHPHAAAQTAVIHYALHQPSVRLISGLPFAEAHAVGQLAPLWRPHTVVLLEKQHLTLVQSAIPAGQTAQNACIGGYCMLFITLQPNKD
ncbi:MAG: phospholipid carrier-dependent glycosyltransferase [Alphaproteobacteria bacterium]